MKREKTAGSDNLPVGKHKDSESTISYPLSWFTVNLYLFVKAWFLPNEKWLQFKPIHKCGP